MRKSNTFANTYKVRVHRRDFKLRVGTHLGVVTIRVVFMHVF